MKNISTILQSAFFVLLLISTALLFKIHQSLSSIPRYSDTYIEQDRERPERLKDSQWNAPLVHIKGGRTEVYGDVDVSGEVEIDQPSYRPIPVTIER